MRHFKVIGQYRLLLPWIMTLTTLIFGHLPPIPNVKCFAIGCLNINGPFLFLGVFFWLFEHKQVSFVKMFLFASLIFLQYWHLTATINPDSRHAHFAALAFLLFLGAWLIKDRLIFNRFILFISELTYCVYLLHNWLFEQIKQWAIAGGLLQHNIPALMLLFAISASAVKIIEKPGIKLGRLLAKRLKTQIPSYRDELEIQPKMDVVSSSG